VVKLCKNAEGRDVSRRDANIEEEFHAANFVSKVIASFTSEIST
jgi:hypothetical protein